jgi:hypothetical protein
MGIDIFCFRYVATIFSGEFSWILLHINTPRGDKQLKSTVGEGFLGLK